jgi:uncharacterized protein with PhoU and TrkA domain
MFDNVSAKQYIDGKERNITGFLVGFVSAGGIAPPEKFIGKTLRELDLRNKFGVQVIAIKEIIPEKTTFIPDADFVIKDSDILIMMGDQAQMDKINKL